MKKLLAMILAITMLAALAGTVSAASPFSDVSETASYYNAVVWANEKGYVNGSGNGKFNPGGNLNRGDFATVMWRYAGKPAVTSIQSFSDVPVGAYYADAVAWAVSKNITNGVGEGRFAPGDSLTLWQLDVMLQRYAAGKVEGITSSKPDTFASRADIVVALKEFADGKVAEPTPTPTPAIDVSKYKTIEGLTPAIPDFTSVTGISRLSEKYYTEKSLGLAEGTTGNSLFLYYDTNAVKAHKSDVQKYLDVLYAYGYTDDGTVPIWDETSWLGLENSTNNVSINFGWLGSDTGEFYIGYHGNIIYTPPTQEVTMYESCPGVPDFASVMGRAFTLDSERIVDSGGTMFSYKWDGSRGFVMGEYYKVLEEYGFEFEGYANRIDKIIEPFYGHYINDKYSVSGYVFDARGVTFVQILVEKRLS